MQTKQQNKSTPESEWKGKRKSPLTWTILYVIGMLGYAVIMFGLSNSGINTIQNFKSSNNYTFTQETLINWRKNYITDIVSVADNTNCPAGYELWYNRSWPGTNVGCNYLANIGDFERKIYAGRCSQPQQNGLCYYMDALNAVPLAFWKESTKICIQRGDTSFLSSPEDCDAGLKRCGTGKVRYCVSESKPCPISDVVLSQEDDMKGYTKVAFSDDTNLFYSRDESKFPISTFKLTEADYCILDGADHISPGRRDFMLLKVKRTPCIQTEKRYITLDSQGEEDLFTYNNLNDTLSNIPGYPELSNNYTWKLGFERYFQWSDQCRSGPLSLKEAEGKIQLTTMLRIAWIAFIITTASAALSGIIFPALHLKRRIYDEDINEAYEQNQRKFFTSRAYVVDKMSKLILLPAIVLAVYIAQRETEWFADARSNACGDEYTNGYFAVYSDKLNKVFSQYITMLFIWLAVIGLDLAYVLYSIFKAKVGFSKFFESKADRDEENVIIISEDEMKQMPFKTNTSSEEEIDKQKNQDF